MGSRRSVEREEFWRLAIAEHRQSGLTVSEFCRRESLSQPSFYAWKRKFRERQGQANGEGTLVPVEVVGSAATDESSDRPSVTIRLPGGVVIDVFSDHDS